jgi:hypothetical protein
VIWKREKESRELELEAQTEFPVTTSMPRGSSIYTDPSALVGSVHQAHVLKFIFTLDLAIRSLPLKELVATDGWQFLQ